MMDRLARAQTVKETNGNLVTADDGGRT
jgi:hypothetical protein